MPVVKSLAVSVLACLILASGCRDNGHATQPTLGSTATETVTAPAAADLLARLDEGQFQILYDAKVHALTGQLLWRRSDGTDRWDFFYRDLKGTPVGESALGHGRDAVGACSWQFNDPRTADVICTISGLFDLEDTLRVPFDVFDLKFEDREEIAGVIAYCYVSNPNYPDGAGRICLSEQGLPLAVESQFGINGPAVLRATDVQAVPDVIGIETLPWNAAERGGRPGSVPVSELVLPDLPALADYLRASG